MSDVKPLTRETPEGSETYVIVRTEGRFTICGWVPDQILAMNIRQILMREGRVMAHWAPARPTDVGLPRGPSCFSSGWSHTMLALAGKAASAMVLAMATASAMSQSVCSSQT